eukprot:m.49441 g.49441  ORF g.49441 m.49441 type:complete len:601 (-) comp11496_c0_seq1:19-1821(-)
MKKFLAAGSAVCAGLALTNHFINETNQARSRPNLPFRMVGRAPATNPIDSTSKQCIVVGAGLEGLTTAYFLRERGWQVTVLDAASGPATQTSFANAGLLCRTTARPIASPSNLKRILSSYTSGHVKINAKETPSLIKWGVWYVRSSTRGRYRHGSAVLAELAALSQAKIDELTTRLSLDFNLQKTGLLVLYRSTPHFDAAIRNEQLLAGASGVAPVALSPQQCVDVEPTLHETVKSIVGGIYHRLDWFGDAHKFCTQIAAACERDGVLFKYNTRVTSLLIENQQVHGVVTAEGEAMHACYVVLAAASDTALLARQAGIFAPIVPIKGYSITLPLSSTAHSGSYSPLPSGASLSESNTTSSPTLVAHNVPDPVAASTPPTAVAIEAISSSDVVATVRADPTHPLVSTLSTSSAPPTAPTELGPGASGPRVVLIDSEADSHVYATPLGNRLRVAGIAEFSGTDKSIRSEVPMGLRKLAIGLYPSLARENGWAALPFTDISAWCGLRPASPDGLPISGPTAVQGLYLNSGHGTLGWSMCAATATLVTHALESDYSTAIGVADVSAASEEALSYNKLLSSLNVNRFSTWRFFGVNPPNMARSEK